MLSPRLAAIWLAKIAPPAGPELQKTHGKAPCRLDRRDAAARGHEIDGAAKLLDLQGFRHAPEITVDQRLDICVGDRGRGALIFANFRAHRRGERHPYIPHLGLQDRSRALFMCGIGVSVNKGECDAFHILCAQLWHQRPYGCFVKRQPDATMRVDALGHREAKRARHQRLRLVDRKVILIVAALGADIEHVAKTFRRDQRRLRASALDDGVGCERSAVNKDVDVADVGAGVGQNETHPVQHRLLGTSRRRQHLARFAVLPDVQHDIRERTSDIHGQPYLGSVKHSKSPRVDELLANIQQFACQRLHLRQGTRPFLLGTSWRSRKGFRFGRLPDRRVDRRAMECRDGDGLETACATQETGTCRFATMY